MPCVVESKTQFRLFINLLFDVRKTEIKRNINKLGISIVMIITIVLLQECDPKLLPDTCTQDKIMYNVLDESPV